MATTPFALLGFGFVLGLRHALDVDHLAAVSTIVSARRSIWSSSLVGALWGLGHTASLFAVAVVLVGLHAEIPPGVARLLELGVAVMLIGLGLNVLRTIWAGGSLHHHVHAHGDRLHFHPHVHALGLRHDGTGHHPVRGRRPFLVGMVHGLAGSGALMLAVLATIPSPGLALAYVGIFGAGSIGGMVVMSTLFGVPFALVGDRFARVELGLRVGAALGSLGVGLRLAWELGLRPGGLL